MTTTLAPHRRPRTAVGARLRPLRAAMFLQGIAPWVPVEKLFMSQIGFNPALIATMAAAYAAVVPLLEIPSGILADRWSRRGVLMLAASASLLSVVVGALSFNIGTYLASAMILGIYFAMQSGTVEALVYDVLLEDAGHGDGFERQLGRVHVLNSAALVGSAAAGGLLAALASPRTTYLVTIPCALLALLVLSRLREPRPHHSREPFTRHLRTTVRVVTSRAGLVPVVLAMALGSTSLQLLFEFGPLWLIAAGASTVLLGPYTAGMTSAFGLGGALAGRLRLDRPRRAAALATALIACGLTVATGGVLLSATAQIAGAMLLVIAGIHLNRRLQDAIPSGVRTGVASGVSTLSWLMFLPCAGLIGLTSQHFGAHAGAWIGTAMTVLIAISLIRTTRQRQPRQTGTSRNDAPIPCR